jgi:hypothetical protein
MVATNMAIERQHQTRQTCTPVAANLSRNGRIGKWLRENPNAMLFRPILIWVYRRPQLYGFLLELRSCLSRIGVVLESRIYSKGISAGPVFQKYDAVGYLVCNRTRQRIQDMQQTNQTAKWELTLLDCELFLRGWDAGEQWGLRDVGRSGIQSKPVDPKSSVSSSAINKHDIKDIINQ